MGVVKGTNQTGYTNTFYRYSRDVMESERILLENGFRDRYGMLMAVAEHVGEDEKILDVYKRQVRACAEVGYLFQQPRGKGSGALQARVRRDRGQPLRRRACLLYTSRCV